MKSAGSTELLFIEPTGAPSIEPVIDNLTRALVAAWRVRRTSEHGHRGVHHCTGRGCKATSDNRDHRVAGYLSHSLCVHYLAHHRAEVPQATLDLIASWPMPDGEPDAFELTGRGGETPGAEAAIARQLEAERLVPSSGQMTIESGGLKWTRASFGEESSGWCGRIDLAIRRLQDWMRGDVVSSAPPGQCSLREVARLTEVAERDGRQDLADAIVEALEGGIDSEPWLQVSALVRGDKALLDALAGVQGVAIRRPGAP